jgi:hypothetical protein
LLLNRPMLSFASQFIVRGGRPSIITRREGRLRDLRSAAGLLSSPLARRRPFANPCHIHANGVKAISMIHSAALLR